jgi:hypothetical protein
MKLINRLFLLLMFLFLQFSLASCSKKPGDKNNVSGAPNHNENNSTQLISAEQNKNLFSSHYLSQKTNEFSNLLLTAKQPYTSTCKASKISEAMGIPETNTQLKSVSLDNSWAVRQGLVKDYSISDYSNKIGSWTMLMEKNNALSTRKVNNVIKEYFPVDSHQLLSQYQFVFNKDKSQLERYSSQASIKSSLFGNCQSNCAKNDSPVLTWNDVVDSSTIDFSQPKKVVFSSYLNGALLVNKHFFTTLFNKPLFKTHVSISLENTGLKAPFNKYITLYLNHFNENLKSQFSSSSTTCHKIARSNQLDLMKLNEGLSQEFDKLKKLKQGTLVLKLSSQELDKTGLKNDANLHANLSIDFSQYNPFESIKSGDSSSSFSGIFTNLLKDSFSINTFSPRSLITSYNNFRDYWHTIGSESKNPFFIASKLWSRPRINGSIDLRMGEKLFKKLLTQHFERGLFNKKFKKNEVVTTRQREKIDAKALKIVDNVIAGFVKKDILKVDHNSYVLNVNVHKGKFKVNDHGETKLLVLYKLFKFMS